jgi:hypothetical protein
MAFDEECHSLIQRKEPLYENSAPEWDNDFQTGGVLKSSTRSAGRLLNNQQPVDMMALRI